jgi:four helix bundle protein
MHATCVEDLLVYQRAKVLLVAVFDLTRGFRSDCWLADQLNASAQSILANIAEGFRQPTDRAFARYLSISSGSAAEARSHLLAAELRGHVASDRAAELADEAQEIASMLGALVRYLHRCDRKNRCPA